jgi:putative FmdB family regulatory protein
MPIYEYECKQCRHRFEYLILASSTAAKCPVCESRDLEQLISTCSISSETTRQANLKAAHRKVAAARNDRVLDQHQQLHEHFEDRSAQPGKADPEVTNE